MELPQKLRLQQTILQVLLLHLMWSLNQIYKMEILNIYRIFFSKREPIALAASNALDAASRVMKFPLHDFMSDPVIKIELISTNLFV